MPTLRQLDVSTPAKARVVARPDAGVVPAALAPGPSGLAVDASSRNGTLVRVEAVSLAHTAVGTRASSGVKASDGRILRVVHLPRHGRLGIVGNWLAAVQGDSLHMLVLGTQRKGQGRVASGDDGAFSFAVQ